MNPYAIFYIVMAFVLIIGLGIQLVPKMKPPAEQEHYIGANMTESLGMCILTWMGGWDYDSFFDDVRVNNISVGHVRPGYKLYVGTCKNITVEAYERSVKSYVTVYHYTHTGEV